MRTRRSIRLPDYDYTQSGAYFVTICTHQRACVLSEIVNAEVHISEFGQVIQAIWTQLPSRYPRLGLDEYVIMPNHIHGILIISGDEESVGAIHELPDSHQFKQASPPGPLSGRAKEGEKNPTGSQVPLSNSVGEGDLGGEAYIDR